VDTKGIKQPPSRVIYYRVIGGKRVILSDSEVKRLGQIKSGDPSRMSSKGR
jgi:hypothetical protein